ncbi:STM3941 family protein [uncultured Sneathiella sp.]|uniref:STM3941 family protein n=1 Tax=uncultured Sneathiella sp. TaxID=879315 RepID=UPI0030EED8C9|tara:strand:- start:45665 stop:46213 length:549 start_codon:yes stop_codon:yes gene_type:complete
MSTDDEIIEIRNNRTLALLLMLATGFFAVASILFLNIDISDFWGSLAKGIETQEKGWIFVLGFLFCSALYLNAVYRLFDRRVQLRISKEGLYSRNWSRKLVPWSEIKDFELFTVRPYRTFGLFPIRFAAVILNTTEKKKNEYLNKLFKYSVPGDLAITMTGLDCSYKDILAYMREAHTNYSD